MKKKINKNQRVILLPLVGITLLVVLWNIAYITGVFSRLILPSPAQVIEAFGDWYQTNLWMDLFYTILRLSISLSIGIFIGFIFGVILAVTPILQQIFFPLIDSFRSIPAIALFPLFTAAFGIGELARIASVTFSVQFLVALYTFQGISTVEKSLLLVPLTISNDVKKLRWWVLKEIYIKGALPTILFGLRLSLPIALVVIVATEMMYGTTYGLGSRIISSQLAYRIPPAWAAIILTGLLGYFLNLILGKAEKYYSRWVSK